MHGCAVALVCLCIFTHIVMFCATGCFDVQIAELSAQLGLKQRISHAQDGCMVFMDVLLLWCADIWLHRLGTSFVHVGSSLELLLAKQRIFYDSEVA